MLRAVTGPATAAPGGRHRCGSGPLPPRRRVWTRFLACAGAMGLLSLAAAQAAPAQKVVEVHGDVRVDRQVTWKGVHYRIHGNLVLAKGGVLTLDQATVELMNTYARQYRVLFQGGRLVSTAATIGGTLRDGVAQPSNIELLDGEWVCTDTTVRYCYGITFGWGRQGGKLRATRLIQGPNPDSIIMSGRGDVVIRDSTYAIALNAYADRGGTGVFDLPVNTPISRVFDGSNVPGADYRLQLINTRVPDFWFLFVNHVRMDGPPVEIVLRHCPKLIPSVLGHNLTGTVRLPLTLDTPVRTGNVTWRRESEPVSVIAWGLYLTGDQTNFTVAGPTTICELMLWDGRCAVVGDDGTYNAAVTATTVECGFLDAPGRPELHLRNVSLGNFYQGVAVRGQVTAQGDGKVIVEHARCADLLLITKGRGTITLQDIRQEGQFTRIEEGGPIHLP